MNIYNSWLANTRTSVVALSVLSLVACGGGSSDESDTVTSAPDAINSAPVVSLSGPSQAAVGDTLTVSAMIVDDGPYSIMWLQTQGASVELGDSTADSITFVVPEPADGETLSFQVSVDDGVNDIVSAAISIEISTAGETGNNADQTVWVINTTGERASHILDSNTGLGVEVDVQSVSEAEVNGKDFVVVNSQGIPKYDVMMTQQILDELTMRPKAGTDFVVGQPSVGVGEVVKFGQDIGYQSNRNCTDDYGYGYWPPGPECPTQDAREVFLPVEPTPTQSVCESGLGKVGIMVNGSSIYNWSDGFTYNQQGDWSNLAPEAERYDVDICGGHAAMSDYHHHFYTSCLADLLDDDGSDHSPIYGYAADGYPIYGPWEADGVLAVSAWRTRDYDDDNIGCSDGQRSCVLVDQYDVSLGTQLASSGPGFDQTVTSLSGNEFVAENGFYYEDYYWDASLTALGGEYLDQYNAHSDEQRGYHYHITIVMDDEGNISPAFPYIIGTRFAGQLEDNAVARCSTGQMGPP